MIAMILAAAITAAPPVEVRCATTPIVIDAQLNEAAWSEAKKQLERAHHSLITAARGLDEARLEGPILVDMPSVYVTLHGVIQHELYHTGQIAILKKASTRVL